MTDARAGFADTIAAERLREDLAKATARIDALTAELADRPNTTFDPISDEWREALREAGATPEETPVAVVKRLVADVDRLKHRHAAAVRTQQSIAADRERERARAERAEHLLVEEQQLSRTALAELGAVKARLALVESERDAALARAERAEAEVERLTFELDRWECADGPSEVAEVRRSVRERLAAETARREQAERDLAEHRIREFLRVEYALVDLPDVGLDIGRESRGGWAWSIKSEDLPDGCEDTTSYLSDDGEISWSGSTWDPPGDGVAPPAEEPRSDPAMMVGMDTSWPVFEVLRHLVRATGYLLHDCNYDRHGWEIIDHARQAGIRHIETAGLDLLPNEFSGSGGPVEGPREPTEDIGEAGDP